jgi:hypothetical protein
MHVENLKSLIISNEGSILDTPATKIIMKVLIPFYLITPRNVDYHLPKKLEHRTPVHKEGKMTYSILIARTNLNSWRKIKQNLCCDTYSTS